MENGEVTARNQPRFNPRTQEWSVRTGPNTWQVWKHGAGHGDVERLRAELEKELAREDGRADLF